MPMSTDVNLPKSHPAVFPNRCVRCEADPQSYSLRIWAEDCRWWSIMTWWFGRWFSVRVPACRACGWRIRLQRVGGLLAILVMAALFMFYVWPHIDEFVPRAIRKWVAVGLTLICLLPWFLWQVWFPPCIDLSVSSDSVDYEFSDFDYAYEFAELNAEADWVKIE